jgi:hypothetical protein
LENKRRGKNMIIIIIIKEKIEGKNYVENEKNK